MEPSAKRGRAGFTLVEILAVIAILSVLLAILIPVVGSVRERSQVAASSSNLRQIGAAALLYTSANKGRLVPHAIFDPDLGENREWCYGYFQTDTENALAEGILGEYLANAEEVLRCPRWEPTEQIQNLVKLAGKPGFLGYGYNGLNLSRMLPPEQSPEGQAGHYRGYPLATVSNPSETVMFATSAQEFGGPAGPQEMIWGPDHVVKQACVRLVTDSEALVCFVDGSVRAVAAIPIEGPTEDGVVLGHLDADQDGQADSNIWKRD